MKIEEAIEILTGEIDNITISHDVDVPSALKLGIEAMKRLILMREHPRRSFPRNLVGETEE